MEDLSFGTIVTRLKSVGTRRSALVAGAAFVILAGAMLGRPTRSATTPKLSGTYAISFTTLCQSTLTISAGSGSNALDSTEHAVAATFKPSKSNALVGTVEMKGWKVSGALLDVNGSGDAFAEATLSRTGVSYAVNANSMTIGGVPYKVIPGVVTSDVIQQFAYVGIETGNNCATNGVAFIQ
jgi:hypothetical protein